MAWRHHRPASTFATAVRRYCHEHCDLDTPQQTLHALSVRLLLSKRALSWQPMKNRMRQFSTSASHREFLPIMSSANLVHRRRLTTDTSNTSYERNLSDLRKTATIDYPILFEASKNNNASHDPASSTVIHNTHLRSPAMSYEKNIDTLRLATAEPEPTPLPKLDLSHLHTKHERHRTEDQKSSSSSSTSGTVDEDVDRDVEKLRRRLLSATLPFVREYGWSQQAIIAGAESLGESSSIHGLFQRGGIDLIWFFYHDCNRRLRENMSGTNYAAGGVSNKLSRAIHERLEMLGTVIDSWPQALATMSMPQNAFGTLRALGELMDDVWYAAGDRSSDFSYYTKRASLASVYCATELYMLQDTSTGFENTWAFLDRRLRDFGICNRVSSRMMRPFSGRSRSSSSMPSDDRSASMSMPSPFNVLKRMNPLSHLQRQPQSPIMSPFSSKTPPAGDFSTRRFDASPITTSGVVDGTYTGSIIRPASAASPLPGSGFGAAATSTSTSMGSSVARPNIFNSGSVGGGSRISTSNAGRVVGNNPIAVVGETVRNVFGAQKPGSMR